MTEEEEAELLARALEDGSEPAAIADALEVAHAVRTRRAALLQAERARLVLAVVEQRLASARRRKWLLVSGAGGALAMAAAAMLVFVQVGTRSSEPARVASAPSAPEAAKQAIGGGSAAVAEWRAKLLGSQRLYAEKKTYPGFDLALLEYRAAYLAALEVKYQ